MVGTGSFPKKGKQRRMSKIEKEEFVLWEEVAQALGREQRARARVQHDGAREAGFPGWSPGPCRGPDTHPQSKDSMGDF